MIRGRIRRREGDGDPDRGTDDVVEIDPAELTGVFAAPGWLRDSGLTAIRKGHWIMFIIGIFVPLFWIIGALMPPTRPD